MRPEVEEWINRTADDCKTCDCDTCHDCVIYYCDNESGKNTSLCNSTGDDSEMTSETNSSASEVQISPDFRIIIELDPQTLVSGIDEIEELKTLQMLSGVDATKMNIVVESDDQGYIVTDKYGNTTALAGLYLYHGTLYLNGYGLFEDANQYSYVPDFMNIVKNIANYGMSFEEFFPPIIVQEKFNPEYMV